MAPVAFGAHLPIPFVRQWWKHRHSATVLEGISQHAALRDGAKALRILTCNRHMFGIQCEHGISRSIFPDPNERLRPWIIGGCSRPLYMRPVCRKRARGTQHSCAQWKGQDSPAPEGSLQYLVPKKTAPGHEPPT